MSLFRGKLFAGALFAGALFGPSESTEVHTSDYGTQFYEDGLEPKKVTVKSVRRDVSEEDAVIMAVVQFVLEQS
jgi:hypothetical protein